MASLSTTCPALWYATRFRDLALFPEPAVLVRLGKAIPGYRLALLGPDV